MAKTKQILGRHDACETLVHTGSASPNDKKALFSPRVDYVSFIRANTSGGYPGTNRVAPTSAAIVAVTSEVIRIGRGEVSRREILTTQRSP